MRLSSLMIAGLLAFSANSWAARDFTPQAGTWIVSSELNGKPGRGLAIDVQGNTFFMQVFGYEKNGDATFYTATGQLEGNTVIAPLVRYTGGRSFGSEARDAVEDSSPGTVTVSFSNGLNGTVQFPGEAPAAMERFAIKETTPSISNPLAQLGQRALTLLILDEDLQFKQIHSVLLQRNDEGQSELLEYIGPDQPRRVLPCTVEVAQSKFQCVSTDSGGYVDSLRFQIVGGQIAGQIKMKDAPGRELPLIGQSDSVMHHTHGALSQQTYETLVLSGSTITGTPTRYYHQMMPSNGTWVVQDELTGKPGRGLALDVQNSTMVLQVFNYGSDGQPTFHMGSGVYESAGADTLGSRADFALGQYAGGRNFGGAAQSAHAVGEAGPVRVEMSVRWNGPGRTASQIGTITFPGEAPKTIERLRLDSQPSLADRLFGEWYAPPLNAHFTLDREKDGAVQSTDGSISCEQKDPAYPDRVTCTRVGMQTEIGTPVMSNFSIPLLNRGSNWIQIRDRFGNLQGLGNID